MIDVRTVTESDLDWVRDLLEKWWGSTRVVSRGRVHQADVLPGFVATSEDERVGLATYAVEGDQCEMVTLNSLIEHVGVGIALMEAVKDAARAAGCKRLWLVTTNDNLNAIRFYQRRQFGLVAVHRNAVEESRKLKPEIPLTGIDDIPLRDEIELEFHL
ncbi:MAG: GNAT family N-acetyltransferase [Phycisphaerales bacterium]|nr:MAG: GNAT family N-acetyltransferase [Phycisphaerales bacterium]